MASLGLIQKLRCCLSYLFDGLASLVNKGLVEAFPHLDDLPRFNLSVRSGSPHPTHGLVEHESRIGKTQAIFLGGAE